MIWKLVEEPQRDFCCTEEAMAQKANGTKKANPWGLSSKETSGWSWGSFGLVMAVVTVVVLLQALVVTRSRCISRSVQSLSTMVGNANLSLFPAPEHNPLLARHPTELSRVVFAIAGAAKHWPNRKNYINRWYNMDNKTRAIVWLDTKMNGTWEKESPPFRVSEKISHFSFNPRRAAATRISRIVSETFRLGLRDVDWFVMGDDDTFFLPDNVVKVLSKYDPARMYYIGSSSETHIQNLEFSFDMAFGGGGFAISKPLASELANMQDACLVRYPDLYGSDARIFACMAELGVPLTKELGFHQMDIRGNAMGFLAAHPRAPLVSMHHLDIIFPIFPGLSRYAALDHLIEAVKVESASVFQQSICYAKGQKWSFSISWGYVVQVYNGFLAPRELEMPLRTFTSTKRGTEKADFPFNTRDPPKDPCKQPALFFMKSVHGPSADTDGSLESVYLRNEDLKVTRPSCDRALEPLSSVRRIRVLKKPVADSWFQAPRRPCCTITDWNKTSIELELHDCQPGETLLTGSLH